MAIARPKPKHISAEVAQQITERSAQQTGEVTKVTSYDPQNYPCFQVPINQKVLIYIPNHQVQNPDGSMGLRKDSFPAHPVRMGRQYSDIRCINGLVSESEELKWDGTCPLCDALNEVWDLYRHEYNDIARTKGIDPESAEAQEALKQDRKDLVTNQVLKKADRWLTFPIVLIDCVEKDGQKTTQPKLDANNKMVGVPMWYSIRESTFIEKWEAGYDSLDGETPTSPAGLWAILNFTYQSENGKHDRMGSARSLKVTFKTMENYSDWARYFDELTKDWTPEKAQEVVVLDAIRSMEETQEVCDSIMKPVRDKLALYSLSAAAGTAGAAPLPSSSNAEAALANFQPQEVQPTSEAAPATPAAPAQPAGALPAGSITAEMPSAGVVE